MSRIRARIEQKLKRYVVCLSVDCLFWSRLGVERKEADSCAVSWRARVTVLEANETIDSKVIKYNARRVSPSGGHNDTRPTERCEF